MAKQNNNKKDDLKSRLQNLKDQLDKDSKDSIMDVDSIPRLDKSDIEYTITDRQWNFILNIVSGCNASEAARKAGYSEKSARVQACMMLKKQHIRNEIEKLRYKLANQSLLTKDYVIVELRRIMEIALTQEKTDLTNALKAWNMISKMKGFYESQDTTTININDIKSIEVKINKPNQELD